MDSHISLSTPEKTKQLSPYPPKRVSAISQKGSQESQPPKLTRLSPPPELQKYPGGSTAKTFSSSAALGMPPLNTINPATTLSLALSSGYEKTLQTDSRFFGGLHHGIPTSYSPLTTRTAVPIVAARTMTTNSPATPIPAMATIPATSNTQQKSPYGLYTIHQSSMPRYSGPKNLFGAERQQRQPPPMIPISSSTMHGRMASQLAPPSQNHGPLSEHSRKQMMNARARLSQSLPPGHGSLLMSRRGPLQAEALESSRVTMSPERSKGLELSDQPYKYTQNMGVDEPRTKERSNSSPSSTPKAAQFLLELSGPHPRATHVPLPKEFTSSPHTGLGPDAFPAHTPTPSHRKNNNRDSSGSKSRSAHNRSDTKKNCGRWHPGEHAQFLEGLQQFGRDWKKIATKVTTRTLVQIRTHAQKYFLRLGKERRKASGQQVSPADGKGVAATPTKSRSKYGMKLLDTHSSEKKSDSAKRSRAKPKTKKRLSLDEGLSMMLSPPQVHREPTHALRSPKPNSKSRNPKLRIGTEKHPPMLNLDSVSSPGGFGVMSVRVRVPPLKVPLTPVNNSHSSDSSFTALHKATMAGQLDEVQKMLKHNDAGMIDVNKQDHQGYTPLMIAASLQNEQEGMAICNAILSLPNVRMHMRDREGLSALHWAAAQGNPGIVEMLVNHNCDVNICAKPGRRIQPIFREKQRRSGRIGVGWNNETPLHRAARLGRDECVAMLLKLGANYRARNERGESAFDVAGMYTEQVASSARSSVRALFHKHSKYFQTLVLHHDDCLEHKPVPTKSSQGKDPWEHPDRIRAVLTALNDPTLFNPNQLEFSSDFAPADRRSVLRVHSKEYVNFVHDLAKSIECPEPFTPKVQRQLICESEEKVKESTASDTSFSKGSLKAALAAAGAICHAVDEVIEGRRRNSFCAVRPPGHHAGVNGLLLTSTSCGFCIFNNVAIGALHALAKHGTEVEKVAIIDIDVHHGNGTEEIVQQFPHPNKLLFVSLHIFDKDGDFCFYPGSGQKDVLEDNVINVALKPLWRRNVRRSSRSSRATRDCKCGRNQWNSQVRARVIAPLRAFNPDLILISAGFDACKNDVGNGRYDTGHYQGGMDLNAHDYASVTRAIMKVADICCHGRVVSILEGGYGNHRRRSEPIDRVSLARVCAAHVCSLAGHTHDWQARSRSRKKTQNRTPAKSSPAVSARLRSRPSSKQNQNQSKTEDTSESEGSGTDNASASTPVPEDTQLYCTCREPTNSEEFMIECSSGIRCNGWVHPKCMGLTITENDAAQLDNFVCDWCKASAGPGTAVLSSIFRFNDARPKPSKRKRRPKPSAKDSASASSGGRSSRSSRSSSSSSGAKRKRVTPKRFQRI